MKMKGTRREMGRNRARVKSRLIPLAQGTHLYSVLHVAAGSAIRKEAMGVGWRGDASVTLFRVFNFPETVIKQISARVWQASQTFVGRKLRGGDLSEVTASLGCGFLMAYRPFAFKKIAC